MRSFCLLLLGALLAACSSTPDNASNEVESTEPRICTPRAYVFCVCANGSHGTKQCATNGRTFGPCTGCDGEAMPEGCTPGAEEPCLCKDGTEGYHTCQQDGASFDACTGCGGTPQTCEPGDEKSCLCENDTEGVQTCQDDGSFGACEGCQGTGGSSTGNDSCPGVEIAIGPGEEIDREGTTVGASDDYQAPCGQEGPEVVYQIVPGATGTLTVTVQGKGQMDPVLYAWSGDCGEGSGEMCADSSGSGSTEEIALPVGVDSPVFVVVDSNGSGGGFTLTAALDVGASGDRCPGLPVALSAGAMKTLSGSTKGLGADYTGTSACSAAKAGELVYAVQAAASGQLTARLTPLDGQDTVLYARQGGCEDGSQLACSNEGSAGTAEEISFPVVAGQLYSLFADGASAGSFDLELSLSSKFCGDGKVASPEQCDDNNTDPDDGCSPDCKVEQNPPEVACPGVEVHVFSSTVLLSGSTDSYDDLQKHPTCGGTPSPDRVYRIIPEKTGTLTATITAATFDALLYARSGACSGTSAKDLGCGDAIGNGGDELALPVLSAGVPIWLVVDGWEGDDKKGNQGDFTLSLSIK